jgi:hypothetical protein
MKKRESLALQLRLASFRPEVGIAGENRVLAKPSSV